METPPTVNIGQIQGGTNAGWRRPKAQPTADWKCADCGARLKYYWANCPTDGTRRDT